MVGNFHYKNISKEIPREGCFTCMLETADSAVPMYVTAGKRFLLGSDRQLPDTRRIWTSTNYNPHLDPRISITNKSS